MGPVLTVTIFASGVAYAWYKGHNVTLSNNVSPLLAVVVRLSSLPSSDKLLIAGSYPLLGWVDSRLQVRSVRVEFKHMADL